MISWHESQFFHFSDDFLSEKFDVEFFIHFFTSATVKRLENNKAHPPPPSQKKWHATHDTRPQTTRHQCYHRIFGIVTQLQKKISNWFSTETQQTHKKFPRRKTVQLPSKIHTKNWKIKSSKSTKSQRRHKRKFPRRETVQPPSIIHTKN